MDEHYNLRQKYSKSAPSTSTAKISSISDSNFPNEKGSDADKTLSEAVQGPNEESSTKTDLKIRQEEDKLVRQVDNLTVTLNKQISINEEYAKRIHFAEKDRDGLRDQLSRIKELFAHKDASFEELHETLLRVKQEINKKSMVRDEREDEKNEIKTLRKSLESAATMVRNLENCLSAESVKNEKLQKELKCAVQVVNEKKEDLRRDIEEVKMTTKTLFEDYQNHKNIIFKIIEKELNDV